MRSPRSVQRKHTALFRRENGSTAVRRSLPASATSGASMMRRFSATSERTSTAGRTTIRRTCGIEPQLAACVRARSQTKKGAGHLVTCRPLSHNRLSATTGPNDNAGLFCCASKTTAMLFKQSLDSMPSGSVRQTTWPKKKKAQPKPRREGGTYMRGGRNTVSSGSPSLGSEKTAPVTRDGLMGRSVHL
jgi:hypothetical protein